MRGHEEANCFNYPSVCLVQTNLAIATQIPLYYGETRTMASEQGTGDIEEVPMFEDNNKYTVLQKKSRIEYEYKWISYDGPMMTIER